MSFLHTTPGPRPVWPIDEDWWLTGCLRAWRLDAEGGEKHYFQINKPSTPHWETGLFLPEFADRVAYWLARLGYDLPPDFSDFVTRSHTLSIPIILIQFKVTPTGTTLKTYHVTDERGAELTFDEAWTAMANLAPGIRPKRPWATPIEGFALSGIDWELYSRPDQTVFRFPNQSLETQFHAMGAQCRQTSLSASGEKTWYYTAMDAPLDGHKALALLKTCSPLHPAQVAKAEKALEAGAQWGDFIIQEHNGHLVPVADLYWPVNGVFIHAP